jgi:hypothetical protein
VRQTVQTCLNMMLIDRDEKKALDFCKGTISDLL